MFDLILYEPEIPPNTGNIIRVCANTGTTLHLVHPLGFELDDKRLRRAGLDYREFAEVQQHASIRDCLTTLAGRRVFPISTRGARLIHDVEFQPGDVFILGPETRGLPQRLLDDYAPDHVLRIPMQPESRSINLSNAAAILIYEAWRQQGFAGGG